MIDRTSDLIVLTPVALLAVPALVEGLKGLGLPTKAAGGAAVIVGILLAILATGFRVDAEVIYYGVGFGLGGVGVYSQVDHFTGTRSPAPFAPPTVIELDTMPTEPPQPQPRRHTIGDGGDGFSLN